MGVPIHPAVPIHPDLRNDKVLKICHLKLSKQTFFLTPALIGSMNIYDFSCDQLASNSYPCRQGQNSMRIQESTQKDFFVSLHRKYTLSNFKIRYDVTSGGLHISGKLP